MSDQLAQVVSFEKAREKNRLLKLETNFKNYLSKLKQDELHHEANHLVEQSNKDNVSKELIMKSALLMDELAKRVQYADLSAKIAKLSAKVREEHLDQKLQ